MRFLGGPLSIFQRAAHTTKASAPILRRNGAKGEGGGGGGLTNPAEELGEVVVVDCSERACSRRKGWPAAHVRIGFPAVLDGKTKGSLPFLGNEQRAEEESCPGEKGVAIVVPGSPLRVYPSSE